MRPLHQRLINWWVAKQRERQRAMASRRDFLRTIMVGGAVAPFVDMGGIIERATQPCNYAYETIKDMCSQDAATAFAAREAFAAFLTRPILQVIEQAPVISNLFRSELCGDESVMPLETVWDDGTLSDPTMPSLVEIRLPGIVAPPHNTWCHGPGWDRKRIAICT